MRTTTMKKYFLLAIFAFFATSTAMAQSTFNGLYVGAAGGYSSGKTHFSDGVTNSVTSANFDSPVWDIDAGLGHSILHFFYLGLGAKYQGFTDAKVSKNDTKVDVDNAAFIVLTPGILITQRTLLYANLGLGQVNANYSQDSLIKNATSIDGPHESWSAIYGIGLKRGLNDYISLGAEFNHVDAGSAGLSNNISALRYNEGLINLTFYL